MSELISMDQIEADAINAADNKLDIDKCLQKWPTHVHYYWTDRYYRELSSIEQAEQAA